MTKLLFVEYVPTAVSDGKLVRLQVQRQQQKRQQQTQQQQDARFEVDNDAPEAPAVPEVAEVSKASSYASATLAFSRALHQNMLEAARVVNEELSTKRAREEEEFETLRNQERDRVRNEQERIEERLRRITREDAEDTERRLINYALIRALQHSRNTNKKIKHLF